jgi:16S rRNA processing protein RimM
VELGRIGAPFGLAGWVHVASYTDPPAALLKYRPWRLRATGAEIRVATVAEARAHGAGLVARLTNVEDRNAAAQLTGAVIEVEREALPALRARQFYRADLIGLEVHNTDGRVLGTVAYFVDAPAGTVMVVQERPGAQSGSGAVREHWVLADPTHLVHVDLTAGRVRVDWPAELD